MLDDDADDNDSSIAVLDAKTRDKDERQCCSIMFKYWREKQPQATWRQLINALYAVELNKIANDLEMLLMPGEQKIDLYTYKASSHNDENGTIQLIIWIGKLVSSYQTLSTWWHLSFRDYKHST